MLKGSNNKPKIINIGYNHLKSIYEYLKKYDAFYKLFLYASGTYCRGGADSP